MTRRVKLAVCVLAIAASFSGLVLFLGADSAISARKARLFAGMVHPLIDPLGVTGAACLLLGLGLLAAAVVWRWPSPAADAPVEPVETKTGRKTDPLRRHGDRPWYEQIAPAKVPPSDKKEVLEMSLAEVCAVDSKVLRAHFLSCMEDGERALNDMLQRRHTAFDAAFADDPVALTLDLYSRYPARLRLPGAAPELRRLAAAFDHAVDRGWQLSLAGHDAAVRHPEFMGHGWKVSFIGKHPSVQLSEGQMSVALRTVGRLVSEGSSHPDDKFEKWYLPIIRGAVADHWPKHRDALIAMFSAGFTGHSSSHDAVVKLTESLLDETPLTRADVPELAEFDRASARLDAVRASVFAELGEPLGRAMEEVLDSGGGLLDTARYPGLRSLRDLSPKRRGECFVQLLSTLSGLERHGLDHWEKLKRNKGRYRFGLNHEPDYSVQPEMSFLFLELTRKPIDLPDRDRTVSAFMDLLPLLIYLQDKETVEVVLETARQNPQGQTAGKLRALLATQMEHPFRQFRTMIEDSVRSLPEGLPSH